MISKENGIILKKELSELDRFVLEFIKILKEEEVKYVVVSGYVSILFGRARSTEDIDLLIENLDYNRFKKLIEKINKKFWCLNSEDEKEIYQLLKNANARFSKKEEIIPNIELKFPSNIIENLAIKERIKVKLGKYEMYISPIELQIAYKEEVLKSKKDLEDALHLREIFKDKIKKEKIAKYKEIIKKYL